MEIKIGSVVRSRAGHDSNAMFAVVGVDDKYVYICDGKERPVQRPKRKNPKHISATNFIVDDEDLQTNRKLKKALAKFQSV